ncbi:hypothetical protein DL769_009930 [Monosporascus sp. CRB-8-3]|nr:hypothetical protein DL769_009930 [Monosporascus sp. CRB-8-3]
MAAGLPGPSNEVKTEEADRGLVCYGMLEDLPVTTVPTAILIDSPGLVSAFLNTDGRVQRSSDGAFMGKLDERARECLFRMAGEEGIQVQLMLKSVGAGHSKRQKTRRVALASAILYGPENLSDDVGDFLDKCNYCLQDPFACERNVPYKNPHCLSHLFDGCPMTFELQDLGNYSSELSMAESLTALKTTEDLPELQPPTALRTQLCNHVHPGMLSWARHYGKSRLQYYLKSSCPDIVITTYQTIQSEYRHRANQLHTVFRYKWRRIILDEAHIIRNKTATSEAIMSLTAASRWAVTGTPIQNSLMDLAGLLRFLQFRPYDDPRSFDKDILEPLRREDKAEGIRRLKAFCHAIMIRRSKTVINLPPRQDLTRTLAFSYEEAMYYRKIETAAHKIPEEAIETHTGTGRMWIKTIQLINNMRLFCNLGLSMAATSTAFWEPELSSPWTRPDTGNSIEAVVASETALGGTNCAECSLVIDVPDVLDTTERPYAYYSSCRQVYCQNCAPLNNYEAALGCPCPGEMPCVLRPLSPSMVQKAREGVFTSTKPLYVAPSSKVQAVVGEIQASLPEKNVVFSFWTTSLNMVQQALDTVGIQSVRIDGNVLPARRQEALEQLRNDIEVKVILITVSCGGVGLDLTAASRVHLLEPQWNPALEDQALARVHRMGQRLPVVTIRYVMKDSIEESVASAKGKKLLLAELLPRTTDS